MIKKISLLFIVLIGQQVTFSQQRKTTISDGIVIFESYFDLLNETGSVNPELYIYDFTNIKHAHLGDKIYLHDIYNIPSGWSVYQELIGFYELAGKLPNDYAKTIMHNSLTEETHLHYDKQYAALGYEMLAGRIMRQDTALGKEYLSMAAHVSSDDIDDYICPFWRDSNCSKEYSLRHDSILQVYGQLWSDTIIQAVVDNGDIQAFRMTMEKYTDGRMMILAIFMIDQYGYSPAYEDIYKCMQQCYERLGGKMGAYGLKWINQVLTIPAAINVPRDLMHRILVDMEE